LDPLSLLSKLCSSCLFFFQVFHRKHLIKPICRERHVKGAIKLSTHNLPSIKVAASKSSFSLAERVGKKREPAKESATEGENPYYILLLSLSV